MRESAILKRRATVENSVYISHGSSRPGVDGRGNWALDKPLLGVVASSCAQCFGCDHNDSTAIPELAYIHL